MFNLILNKNVKNMLETQSYYLPKNIHLEMNPMTQFLYQI